MGGGESGNDGRVAKKMGSMAESARAYGRINSEMVKVLQKKFERMRCWDMAGSICGGIQIPHRS